MLSLDSAGPGAHADAAALAPATHGLRPADLATLRARGVVRAVVLAVPLDWSRLGAFGEALRKAGADPVGRHADLAVHESFHLHVQFPAWLDQPRTYAWPAWDMQPDRRELRERCYAGLPELATALDTEVAELLAAFDGLHSDGSRSVEQARHHALRFVELRLARRKLQDTLTVAQGSRRIPCGLAEDLMELEEGAVQWIGHATALRAGLTTLGRLRGSYGASQPDVFYRTGPLQLWLLEGLLGPKAMRSLTASLARAAAPDAPDGSLFALVAHHTR
jgi:hypothetical protein